MNKTGRKKSFIRYEAFGGIALLAVILVLIATFLLEPILEYGIELAGYKSVGSEVNIDKVDVIWSKPALSLYNLQVTDHDDPMRNLIQIGKINITLNWASLLRLSVTSEVSSVEDIMIHSERKKAGKIMPKDKRLVQIGSKTTNQAIDGLKEKSNNDLLTQALSMAQGEKNEKQALEDLENQLNTKKVSKELENKIEALKKDWKDFKNNGLEGEKTKTIVKEIENFKFESGGSSEIASSLKEAKELLKKAKGHYKSLKSELKSLESQSKLLKDKISKTPEAFIEDFNYIGNTLGSDSLSPDQLSASMLASYIAVQLQNFSLVRDSIQNQLLSDINSYSPVDVRDLAPTNSGENSTEEKDVSVGSMESKKRSLKSSHGRWVHFDGASPRPKLWFKRVNINSKAKPGQDLGDFKGVIKNFTTEPQIVGLPMTADITGDVQKIKLKNLNIKALMDYTNPVLPKENVKLTLGSFPVSSLSLVDSSDYLISIAKAVGNTQIDLNLQEDNINLNLDQNFLAPVWDMTLRDKKSEKLEALLDEIKKAGQNLSVRADVTGTIQNPKIGLSSNLGTIIKNALEKQISGKIKEKLSKEQDKINKMLRDKLGPQAKELDFLQASFDKDAGSLDELTNNFEKEIKKVASEKGKEKIDEIKDKLFKKLKF
jgi:uncharacterized protein (TIGR03545 family)